MTNYINIYIMKNIRLFAAAMAAFALLSITSVQAQHKDHGNWQEKMKSEKIAFLTSELDLTPEEAQAFWPVYNQISKEKNDAQKAVMTTYFAMMKAIEEGKANDKEIERLLDEYVAAAEANRNSPKKDVERYRKVLPSKKVVKLYVAEEKFRRNHICAMKGPHGHGQPDRPAPGPRP